jgi:ABC-type uncharacterized transport system ATPase subunit
MQEVEPFPTDCEAKTQLDGMENPPAVLTSPSKRKSISMNQWTARGIAILLITSETIELLILSDRITVMHPGQVTAEFSWNQAAQKRFCQQLWGQFHWSTHPIFKTDG